MSYRWLIVSTLVLLGAGSLAAVSSSVLGQPVALVALLGFASCAGGFVLARHAEHPITAEISIASLVAAAAVVPANHLLPALEMIDAGKESALAIGLGAAAIAVGAIGGARLGAENRSTEFGRLAIASLAVAGVFVIWLLALGAVGPPESPGDETFEIVKVFGIFVPGVASAFVQAAYRTRLRLRIFVAAPVFALLPMVLLSPLDTDTAGHVTFTAAALGGIFGSICGGLVGAELMAPLPPDAT